MATVEGWDAIELWSGGKVARAKGHKDKGHLSELTTFLAACKAGGPWPIPWEHLRGVSAAALLAVRSLREGVAFGCDEAAPQP